MTSIRDYFWENKYNILVSFCEENSIYTVEQLLESDLSNLTDIKGLGSGKLKAIIEKLQAYPTSPEIPQILSKSSKSFSSINSELNDFSVDVFYCLGESERTVETLKENGLSTIGQLKNSNHVSKVRSLVRVFRKIGIYHSLFEEGASALINAMLDCIKEDDSFDILRLRAMGVTLREIGEDKGVSRERIRQKESKILSKMKPLTDAIIQYVKIKKPTAQMLNVNKINKIVKIDEVGAVKYAIKTIMNEYYLEFADKILINNVSGEEVEHKLAVVTQNVIKNAIEFNKKINDITDALISEDLSFVKIHDFMNYLMFNGYKKIGDYVIKKSVSYAYLCTFLIEKYFPKGIRLYNDEDILKLREYASKEFDGLVLPDSDRAFSVRLTSFLVLCDRGTYTVANNIKIKSSLLSEIYNYIQNNTNKTVIFNEIYMRFKPRLDRETNITNRYFLQGVIKYYYSKEFDFTRDCVTVLGCERLNIRSMLRDYLYDCHKPISKHELMTKFPGLTDIILSNIQTNDPAILQWDSKTFIHVETLGIADNLAQTFDSILQELFKIYEGYATEQLLYQKISIEQPELLTRYQIKNSVNLYNLVNFLLKNKYAFRRPHIAQEIDLEDDLCSEYVIKKFLFKDNTINYGKYLKYAEKWKWHIATVYCAFKNVEKELYRIDFDDYIVKENFALTQQQIEQIEGAIDARMYSHDFIALTNIADFSDFPELDLNWNIHLLHTIISKFCMDKYKILSPLVEDRRYIKGAIVPASSKIKQFDELVAYLLKYDVKCSLSSHQLEEYLVDKKIVNKYLPKELYGSPYLLYKNDRFTPINI